MTDEVLRDIVWKNTIPEPEGIRVPETISLAERLFLWKVKMLCGKEFGWPGNGPYHTTWDLNDPWDTGLRENITAIIPPDEYPRGLSIGCAGAEAIMLGKKGYKIVGIDVNPADVEATRAKGFESFRMDMHDLRFPNESFDCAFTHHCYEHGHIPWLQILELWAVMKPNGMLLFVVPPFNGEKSGINQAQGMHESHSMCLHEEQWKAIFVRLGFEVVSEHILGDPRVSGHMAMLLRRQPFEETITNCRFFLTERLRIGEYYSWPDKMDMTQ